MKKILMFILMLTALVMIAGCKGEKMPEISNPNDIYFSTTEDGYTYSLTNAQIYNELKRQVGSNILLDMVDQDLLKSVKKGNTSYWDLISEEELNEELEKEIFPDGKEDLDADEQEEARVQFYDNMFIQYGLNNEAEVRKYFRMNLAKKAYARDLLDSEYDKNDDKKDFKDQEYENYYKNNYFPNYYGIVLSFETKNQVDFALNQWNAKIVQSQWLKLDNTPMTDREIVEAFIGLYNTANSYRHPDYPESTLLINLDDEYKVEDDKIVFELDNLDLLHYTRSELRSLDSQLETLFNDQLENYEEGKNFYTKTIYTYAQGSKHVLAMKILKEDIPTLEAVKAEIREKLLDQKLTSTYISKKLAELRASNNLVIYDSYLEASYIDTAKGYEIDHPKTKKMNDDLVAKTDVKEYDADSLFAAMSAGYGIPLTAFKIEFLRFITNPKFNKIYSLKDKQILDQKTYDIIKQNIADEKAALERGDYANYGFDKDYGWINFIKTTYGVNNEEELFEFQLFTKVKESHAASLGEIPSVDSEIASFYLRHMNKTVADYFNVKGIQLLIAALDENGSETAHENWSTNQDQLAKELYEEVLVYLATELEDFTGNDAELASFYESKLKEVESAYRKAPRFKAGEPQVSSEIYTFKNIQVSKYKTAGLTLAFQNLGTFKNGKQVEELDEVIKQIWNEDSDSKTPLVWSMNPEDNEYDYIVSSKGYHLYINLETIPLTEWSTGKVVPTIEDIIKYKNDDKSVTTKVKNAITTYYNPIYNELTGNNNQSLQIYLDLQGLTVSFNHQFFGKTQFEKYLQLNIENHRKSLTYIDEE
jgi:hypothetical protein